MQTSPAAYCKSRLTAAAVYLFVCHCLIILSPPCLGSLQTPAADIQSRRKQIDIARRAVTFIEHGQWDTAAAVLRACDVNSVPALTPLQNVLNDYQTLQTKRTEKQHRIYSERYGELSITFERIADNDPNISYQNAFRQMYNVWKDATPQQKDQIASQKAFESLMDHARQRAEDFYSQGQWGRAYVNGVQWLMAFKPENADYRELDKKLGQVNAILEFLRKDTCEDKIQRYTPIQRRTVQQVFSMLQANYVNPLPYDKIVSGMRNCAVILADILKTQPSDLVFHFDPNNVTRWQQSVSNIPENFSRREKKRLDREDLEEFYDLLLALNDKTLKMPDGFILSMMTDAALAELDPYTIMVWPFAVKDFDKAMTGQFGGIGVHIRKERDGIRILSLIPDTPAMRAGLQADALIVAVDGESTRELSITCAVQKISGPIGTPVTLTIRTPGSDADELVTLIRGNIVVPVVEGSRQVIDNRGDNEHETVPRTDPNNPPPTIEETQADNHWDYFLDDRQHIGYLRLKQFTEQTMPEVTEALTKLESDGLDALVLDLRGNGGGLLSTALQIADLFVDNGFLLQSRGRNNRFAAWTATDGPARSYPLAILIDGASASASEIVSGILGTSDHRAILVGQRSYGKGSMQEVLDLGPDKGKLKYTAAYYYLPNGMPVANRDTIQAAGRNDWGIAPDITIPLYDFERQQVRKVNSKRTRISNTPPDPNQPPDDSIRQELLSADPQLAVAVLVLKAELAVRP